jgi:16S rRNA (cytosine967-C5)-methyltransferase
VSARTIACEVLLRVWEDDAFAAPVLSRALDQSKLEGRDRGLCTELVYGVLRVQPYLERRLSEFGKLKQNDPFVLAHLLIAGYQIEFLSRVPARAAVNEAVSMVTEVRDKRVGGFVNAVLRRLSESAEQRPKLLPEAVFESTPSWLKKRLVRDLGDEGARALLSPDGSPKVTLRLRRGVDEPAFFAENTERLDTPGAYRYTGGGDPRRFPEFSEGHFSVQELGAQMVAHSLGARPGDRVLDACAGRGQKTFLLLDVVGSEGEVLATDLHQHKVDVLVAEAARQQRSVVAQKWDWTNPPPSEMVQRFDRVLVDAPCTGVGTIHRRPEIGRRLKPEDPERLSELQGQILLNASMAVKPGGVVVFATCSVFREEGEAVLSKSISSGEFSETVPETPIDNAIFGGGGKPTSHFRLLPHMHGTDGYWIARMRRN